MKEIIHVIAFITLLIVIMYGCVQAMGNRAEAMTTYSAEHNCIYDYNGLCYTESERPWLFNN